MSSGFAPILRELAAANPAAPALTCDGQTWSYGELDRRSSQTAQALVRAGVKPGDRVGVLSRNCPEFFEMIFAANKCGAILVGLNWRLAAREIEAITADAEPVLVFTGASGEADLLNEAARAAPQLVDVVTFGEGFEAWRATAPAVDPNHPNGPDDVAMLLYTSGTTGLPKGAMLTNRGLSYTRRLGAEIWGMSEKSVNLVAMPLFHIGGSGYGSSTLLNGGHTILMRDVNLPKILDSIGRYRVTHAFFVPTVLQGLLQTPGVAETDFSSMELLMYGASPISETLLAEALRVLDCEFIQAYGMTETSGTIVDLMPSEHHIIPGRPNRLRSCGQALPFAEIRIVDPATGQDKPVGNVGEIWVRSEMVMKGYWRNPAATAETIVDDGWLRTGDAAYMDDDGFIYLYDRYKDLIISGGENIYPAEVENAVLSHPAVQECAVIGIAHERWGETPRALVVLRPGQSADEAGLVAHCRSRMAHYKCPGSVLFVESLPRNASGKLLKTELRRLYGRKT